MAVVGEKRMAIDTGGGWRLLLGTSSAALGPPTVLLRSAAGRQGVSKELQGNGLPDGCRNERIGCN
jgi:hypothetical protein